MILKAKHSKVYLCCEDEVSGSGSTRPDTNSAQEPGIKAHMLNRVSFHPITRAKRPQAF